MSLHSHAEHLDKALEVRHYCQLSLWHSDLLPRLKVLLLSLSCAASALDELCRWKQARPRLVTVLLTEGASPWSHKVLWCCSRAAQSRHLTDGRARWQWRHNPQEAPHQSWGEAAAPCWSGPEALHVEWSLEGNRTVLCQSYVFYLFTVERLYTHLCKLGWCYLKKQRKVREYRGFQCLNRFYSVPFLYCKFYTVL